MSEEGFDRGDREYPYWDNLVQSLVYRHAGDFMVSVTPMLFNDRVVLTHRSEYPHCYVAGYCYDKGPSAGLAAQVWNPLEEDEPKGYKKVAGA